MTTDERWDELGSRLRRACVLLEDMRRDIATKSTVHDASLLRLRHKAEGVSLAISYWEEMSREAATASA